MDATYTGHPTATNKDATETKGETPSHPSAIKRRHRPFGVLRTLNKAKGGEGTICPPSAEQSKNIEAPQSD